MLDVISYLTYKRTTTEFGSLNDENIYKLVKNYSPYHKQIEKIHMTQILFGCDFDNESVYQSTKFLAKLRKLTHGEGNSFLYKEYPTWTPEMVKRAEEYSFILASNRNN